MPVWGGTLEHRCQIKPLLPEDQRNRHSGGTNLVQTTSRQLRWDMTKTTFMGASCKILAGLFALLAQLYVYKLYMGKREKARVRPKK